MNMQAPIIDTHDYVTVLKEHDFTEPQVKGLVEGQAMITDAILEKCATKQDLQDTKVELKQDIYSVEISLQKEMQAVQFSLEKQMQHIESAISELGLQLTAKIAEGKLESFKSMLLMSAVIIAAITLMSSFDII